MRSAKNLKSCVIGAGQSGLAVAKSLKDVGLPFQVYESGSELGGLWRIDNDSGLSATYKNLHTNTSRHRTAFDDYPMPADIPDFPHHTQMLKYLEGYATRHDLTSCFEYGQRVTNVRSSQSGRWEVVLESGTSEEYGAVIIATGHNWDPNWAEFRGRFAGEELHSFHYRDPDTYKGKRVLVVGLGVSGAEIACDVAKSGATVAISSRSGAHIIPKYVLGRPADHWIKPWNALLPFPVQRRLYATLIWLARGPLSQWNFPEPEHRILEAAPTLSQELLPMVKAKQISMRPGITSVNDHSIEFSNGVIEEYDVLIHATGYKMTVPFLDESLTRHNDIYLPCYMRIVPPHAPGLYFCGFFASQGAAIPVVELQSKWIAALIADTAHLPSEEKMWHEIREEISQNALRYPASSSHRLQLDVPRYMRKLTRLMEQPRVQRLI